MSDEFRVRVHFEAIKRAKEMIALLEATEPGMCSRDDSAWLTYHGVENCARTLRKYHRREEKLRALDE